MRSFLTSSLSVIALAVLAVPGSARIHQKATSTSHQLEQLSTDLHAYMHEQYGPSFGAHGMETAAITLHSTLHDWEHGTASEADVLAAVAAANAAFDDMTNQFNAEGFLSGPNQDKGAKSLYHSVHRALVLVNAYT